MSIHMSTQAWLERANKAGHSSATDLLLKVYNDRLRDDEQRERWARAGQGRRKEMLGTAPSLLEPKLL